MIIFIIGVIIVSIVVSSISYALKLVPHYDKRMFRILVQVLNTGLLTLLLTYLIVNAIEPGWVVLGSMIFLCLIVSIIVTNLFAKGLTKRPPDSSMPPQSRNP